MFSRLRARLIGPRSLYELLLSLAVPMVIQNTVTNVVNLLDNVMVGRVGTVPMSAVAIVTQLIFVFNLCIFGGLSGAGIFSAQYAGAGDNDGIRYCVRVKLCILALVSVVAGIVFTVFPEKLILSYVAADTNAADTAETLLWALRYLRIMMIGLVPFGLTQVLASTLREIGEPTIPMIAGVAALVLNLVGNYLLIFGKFGFPEMGVAGAAIATVVSRLAELAIIAVYCVKKIGRFPFFRGIFNGFRIPMPLVRSVLVKGSPLLINEFFWSSGIALLFQCYSVRGLQVVAAVNIASTAANLFSVLYFASGTCAGIIIGQMLGAGHIDEAKRSSWQIAAASVGVALAMAVCLLATAGLIPNLYNTEPEVRALAASFLRAIAVVMPAQAFAHCCYFVLRSGGQTWITLLFDSFYTICFVFPVAWALAHLTAMPIVPLYFIVQSLEFVKCFLGVWLVGKGTWARTIVTAG